MQDGRIAIGDVEVYELTDAAGPFPMPLDQVFPAVSAEQWEPYRQRYPRAFAGPNTWGTRVGCFLVRSGGRTMLVDTGIGPGPSDIFGGMQGSLPDELRRHGVDVDGVDLVFLTHMHPDHVGWNLTADGQPTFPNARYVLSRTDWQFCHLPEVQAALPPYIGPCLTPLEGLGVLDLIDGETALTEEVRAIPTPGHSPGHMSLLISSRGQEALIMADVAAHPAMVTEESWTYIFEADPAQAVATRRRVLDGLADSGTPVLVGHYPAPSFGRIVREGGRRYWQPVVPTNPSPPR